jgi:hypothetical protein
MCCMLRCKPELHALVVDDITTILLSRRERAGIAGFVAIESDPKPTQRAPGCPRMLTYTGHMLTICPPGAVLVQQAAGVLAHHLVV